MTRKNDWEQKVEETLNSLEGIQRAVANPFLYTRIKARLDERQNKWVKVANFISRPAIAVSVTALFIAVNTWVVIQHPLFEQVAKPATVENDQAFEPEYATVNYSLMDANTTDR